ncbi:hypothetical protein [Caulobacter sp. BE254]|uniref:hypothetical protein n=1 Tax=Caulobacter sp. BE254 TaxID=2817720 RepID=UPI002857EEB9|nr:hypothetical protein [Caulobacter sp. BE254]MDR7114303.1 hypothetical protein [Caulobacter sp. BE254]
MRGAIFSKTILALTLMTASLAQAETPTIRGFRPLPSSRVAAPFTPRPVPVAARTPHFPQLPVSASMPKPDYNKRTMRLVQQNIAMMAAMRAAEAPRRCDPSWSARKLARRGCPPPARPSEPVLELAPQPALALRTVVATAPEASEGQN